MTRIVAGRAGGRRLKVPPQGTRPTSERVREALFSALAARIDLDGARVLDLYAGSGALGLEALSRGAAGVVLVESDARAAAVAAANVAALGLPGAQVRRAPVRTALAAPAPHCFDLVLADPPYATGDEEVRAALAALAANGWVCDGSVVVVERPARSADTAWPAGGGLEWEAWKPRRYGDTRVDTATCYRRGS